jgi:hypothetical protein
MYLNDKEFMDMMKKFFHVLCSVFITDTGFGLTDTEKFTMTKQANSFKLNIQENAYITENGASQKAMITRQNQVARYPKEIFGFPIIAYAIPLINNDTDNVVGTITFAVSQEKENDIIETAKELQSFSEQLSLSSQELSSSSQELSVSSQAFNTTINNIQQQIKSMDDILKYINNVANTTNLLGLNAAIEAARAGEHGRGFAVVAEEIRKLAQSSKSSTENITTTLTTIRDDINKMIDSINTFAEVSEEQSAQTQQVAAGAERLNELSINLIKASENL